MSKRLALVAVKGRIVFVDAESGRLLVAMTPALARKLAEVLPRKANQAEAMLKEKVQ